MGVYLDEDGHNRWAPPVPSNAELAGALKDLIAAMEKSVAIGCTEHLDAGDDEGSDWWHGPIERAKKLLSK